MNGPGRTFRLNQAISKSGYCSRRQADGLIAAGRVAVNGRVVTDFSYAVDPEKDQVRVDGRPVEIRPFVYVVMYKPRGIVTTCADEKGRKSVLDLLPASLRHLRPVGRLDMQSEGLLLVTNDGQLTQMVTHPLHHLVKKYVVTVRGKIKDRDLRRLASGVLLSDGMTQPSEVTLLGRDEMSSRFEIALREGRNRQIRRMCAELGYAVSRLIRVSIGGLQLGQMSPGSWRFLTEEEVRKLGSV